MRSAAEVFNKGQAVMSIYGKLGSKPSQGF